jgi:Family of unknown function (DUF6055)
MKRCFARAAGRPAIVMFATLLGCGGGGGSTTAAGSGGTAPAQTGGSPGPTAGSGGNTGGTSAGSGGVTPGSGGRATGSGGTGRGGATATGGAPGNGGMTATGGTIGTGGPVATGGTPGSCDMGTTTTAWATSCQAAPATTCVSGTWTDPGSTTNDPVVCQSAHFAVHAPSGTITAAQCTQATDQLENVIWPNLFGSPIYFPEPYCSSATKYKASIVIHSDYGLTGGGWGTGYMGMWVGPGATADHWGLAHEFMHAVQSTTRGLSCGGNANSNFCGWIYESHANWRAFQLPEYHTTNVHCSEYLDNAPHLYLGSTRDRYCNWQFMEYLKDRFCYSAVNAIWTAATPSNDPFTNIMSTRGWSVAQLNDFFAEWAMHNITWDYVDPAPEATAGTNLGSVFRSNYGLPTDTSKPERRLRLTRLEQTDAANRRYAVHPLQAPQRWGYDVVRLFPDAGATSVTVTFRGVLQAAAHADFRWGIVATDAAVTKPRYSKIQSGTDGALTFCVNAGESVWLVVMATPSVQQQINWDQLYPTVARYPYMIQVGNGQPDGYQPNAPNPSPAGARWSNGGGWVASGASVATGAYVGPLAAVLSGTVGAGARIDGHAVILGGTVTAGTVTGLSIVGTGMTVNGGTENVSWPYAPGWFERPQSISGTAQLLGDIEYRGASMTESSGSFCGFVDNTVGSNCAGADVTPAPPYAWRD